MAKTVSESIYRGATVVVPMADVQHIEELPRGGLWVISGHTKYNFEHDIWENPIFIPDAEKEHFLRAWCTYRSELEADTLIEY